MCVCVCVCVCVSPFVLYLIHFSQAFIVTAGLNEEHSLVSCGQSKADC